MSKVYTDDYGQQFYNCGKCSEPCLIEFDSDHPGFPIVWCDKCGDYPGGFYENVELVRVIEADWMGSMIDSAMASRELAQLERGAV